MQFEYINIKKLFGLYDYNINLNNDDKLLIITGPNGYGKTTILTILDSLSPASLYYFYLLKFMQIEVGVSDGSCILISQSFEREKNSDLSTGSDTKHASVKEVRFEWKKDGKVQSYFLYNDNIIRKVSGDFEFRHGISYEDGNMRLTRSKLYLKNRLFNEYVAHHLGQDLFLMQLEGIQTNFIHANRIYNEANEKNDVLPIQNICKVLKRDLQDAYRNYLIRSQRIDGQFIKCVISKEKVIIEEDTYCKLAEEVKRKRDSLAKFKLVDLIEIPAYNKDDGFILYNYVKGLKEKYDNYENLAEKLELFDKLLKEKQFANKDIKFSSQHGFQIVSSNGDILDESLLSSGEQNEMVLLFRLIFEVSDNSVLLIDEPENSLHVVWQQKFLDDIQEIAQIKKLQVIISTHSISIATKGGDRVLDLYYMQQ